MTARILSGNVFDLLPTIEPGSVDCCISSPPSLGANEAVQFPARHPEGIALFDVLVRKAFDRNEPFRARRVGEILVAGDLGSVLAAVSLQESQGKNHFGLPPFYPKEREQGGDCLFGSEITQIPAVDISTVGRLTRFQMQVAAEQVNEKLDARKIDHANLNLGVIARCDPASASVRLSLFDSEIAFAIDEAGAVR